MSETPSADEATDVIAVDGLSTPVFVDASGRRGKRIRIVFGVFGTATLIYAALVATSLAGGPLKPQQLLPFPELVNNLPVLDQPPAAKPGAKNTPTANRPAVTTAKKIAGRPVASGAAPTPSAAGAAPVVPAPAPTTTAPPAEGTAAPAPPPPTVEPPRTPQPTAAPAVTGSPTPTAGQTEGTATALPVVTPTPTAAPSHSATTVPVGETTTAVPSRSATTVRIGETSTATASAAPMAGGAGRAAGRPVATPGASVSAA